MVLGVETGQQTPPNSPATPVDVSCDRMTAGEGRSFEVEQLLSVGSDNAANFAKGSSGSEHLQQHQDLELIRQQMLVNEFTRFTGYPADQAANLLCHFGWDYQAAVSDFFDEVRVAQQNTQQMNAIPPQNTPLTPPAFPTDITLSFNQLTTDGNGSLFNMPNSQTTMSPFIQSQGHDPIRDVNGCGSGTFESPSQFSPVGEATSPLHIQRGAYFHNGPFPMEIGGSGGGASATMAASGYPGMCSNNSQCNTPASTPGSAGSHFSNQNPFSFQQQLGQTAPTFGFGTASCSFQNSRTAYRCGASELRASDSWESME